MCRTLSACFNPLGVIPAEIGNLTFLSHLWLVGCQIATLPPEIGQLTSLTKLSMRNNNLSVIPAELGQLLKLQWLCLAQNQLDNLPEEIGRLECLVYLNLNNNLFSSIPECLLRLSTLTSLHMKKNCVRNVPDNTILALSQLDRLDLRENKLHQRPAHWKVRSHPWSIDVLFIDYQDVPVVEFCFHVALCPWRRDGLLGTEMWWSLCTLYLYACQVRPATQVFVVLMCCKCWLTPLCVDFDQLMFCLKALKRIYLTFTVNKI